MPRRPRHAHALWALISTWEHRRADQTQTLLNKRSDRSGLGVRSCGNAGQRWRCQRRSTRRFASLARRIRRPTCKLQVAIAARKIEGLDPLPVLVEVLANAGDDKLIPHIVWQNLHPLLGDAVRGVPGRGEEVRPESDAQPGQDHAPRDRANPGGEEPSSRHTRCRQHRAMDRSTVAQREG